MCRPGQCVLGSTRGQLSAAGPVAGRRCVFGTAATATGHRRVLRSTPARRSHIFRAPTRRGVARARESGQEAVPQRDTAGDGNCSAPLLLTIRSPRGRRGCECSQAILLASYATTWPPAELIFGQPLAWEHCCQPLASGTVFCWEKGCTDLISSNLATSRLGSEEPSPRPQEDSMRLRAALLCRSRKKRGVP